MANKTNKKKQIKNYFQVIFCVFVQQKFYCCKYLYIDPDEGDM